MELTVIVLSAPIQIIAALFPLGMIRVINRRTSWVPIAAALFFVALRRIISLWGMLYEELPHAQDLWAESVMLASLLSSIQYRNISLQDHYLTMVGNKKTSKPHFRNYHDK